MTRALAILALFATAAHADPAKPDARKQQAQRHTLGIGLLVTGAGLDGAGLGFLVLGAHQNTRVYQGHLATAKDIADTASRGKFYNVGAVVGLSAGTAALVAGAILVLMNPSDDVAITPFALDHATGVLLTRRF